MEIIKAGYGSPLGCGILNPGLFAYNTPIPAFPPEADKPPSRGGEMR